MQRILLHVGYHKTGSTWLQHSGFKALGDSERLSGPSFRGACKEVIDSNSKDPGSLLKSLVEEVSRTLAIISFEDFSGNMFDPARPEFETARRLSHLFPTALVLIVIRSQRTMIPSIYAQYVKKGGYHSIEDFVSGQTPGASWNADHLEYDQLIGTYRRLFERVLILPYEWLRSDPSAFLHRLATEVDVPLVGPIEPTVLNPSLRGWQLRTMRVWNRLGRRSEFNQRPLLELRGGGWLRKILQRSSRSSTQTHELDDDAVLRYGPSNRLTAQWCGLAGFGYPGID